MLCDSKLLKTRDDDDYEDDDDCNLCSRMM